MTYEDFIKAHPTKKEYFVEALETPMEKGKKFSIVLPKGCREKFLRILVDKGLLLEFDNEMQKCDYTFIRCAKSDYYFVELKGSDIEKAYNQIVSTITYFKTHYKITHDKTYAFIASSSAPRAADQRFLRLKEEFKKKKIGVEINRQTNHYKHQL